MARITFDEVTKIFDGEVTALADLSLEIADGELLVLVGPSGCGKSTVLRLLAGLETITAGEIRADGRALDGLTPQERNVAVVFQNYALYPHKTVRQNLDFPLRMMGLPRDERRRRIDEAARLLRLGPVLDRRPRALSGGQQQRVAMGRAIVREPIAFLMDEPLSNLDAKLRVEIRAEIAALQERIGTTTLYVTHDQVEAMTLGDRVGVLRDGRLQQVAPAQEIYARPANVFVATFIGSPRMNVVRARVRTEDGGGVALAGGEEPLLLARSDGAPEPAGLDDGDAVLAGLRPEAFRPAGDDERDGVLEVTVRAMEALGHERIVHADCGLEILADADLARLAPPDGEGRAHRQTDRETDRDADRKPDRDPDAEGETGEPAPLIARLPEGDTLRRGDRLRLAVRADRLHLFGADGTALERA